MTLNLVAQLSELGIGHHLLLGGDAATCEVLRRRGRVACVWSSYLQPTSSRRHTASSRAASPPPPPPRVRRVPTNELMWLQRHHYVGRAIGAGLNVLLLDSDVLIARSPYPFLNEYDLEMKSLFDEIDRVIVAVSNRPMHT